MNRTPMKKHAIVLLFTGLFLSVQAESRQNFCSITINSNDEINVFKKMLPASEFNFIELTEVKTKQSITDHESPIGAACAEKIKCDILLISGHFGGTFTGSSDWSLPLKEISQRSCSDSCAGIFQQPKEVFLFGCNTLASKEKDFRTPEEYARALRDHGYSQSDAEQIAMIRYGPIGDKFSDSIRIAFPNTKHIYGFHSVAPKGETASIYVRDYIKNVFKSAGSYSKHLNEIEKESFPAQKNNDIAQAFRHTYFAEATGYDGEYRKSICSVQDTRKDIAERLTGLEGGLNSESRLVYIPFLQTLLNENYRLSAMWTNPSTSGITKTPTLAKALQTLTQISNNTDLHDEVKKQLHNQMRRQGLLETWLTEFAMFSQTMKWISPQEHSRFIHELVAKKLRGIMLTTSRKSAAFSELSNEQTTALCALSQSAPGGTFSIQDLPKNWQQSNTGRKLFLCMQVEPELSMIDFFVKLVKTPKVDGTAKIILSKLAKSTATSAAFDAALNQQSDLEILNETVFQNLNYLDSFSSLPKTLARYQLYARQLLNRPTNLSAEEIRIVQLYLHKISSRSQSDSSIDQPATHDPFWSTLPNNLDFEKLNWLWANNRALPLDKFQYLISRRFFYLAKEARAEKSNSNSYRMNTSPNALTNHLSDVDSLTRIFWNNPAYRNVYEQEFSKLDIKAQALALQELGFDLFQGQNVPAKLKLSAWQIYHQTFDPTSVFDHYETVDLILMHSSLSPEQKSEIQRDLSIPNKKIRAWKIWLSHYDPLEKQAYASWNLFDDKTKLEMLAQIQYMYEIPPRSLDFLLHQVDLLKRSPAFKQQNFQWLIHHVFSKPEQLNRRWPLLMAWSRTSLAEDIVYQLEPLDKPDPRILNQNAESFLREVLRNNKNTSVLEGAASLILNYLKPNDPEASRVYDHLEANGDLRTNEDD